MDTPDRTRFHLGVNQQRTFSIDTPEFLGLEKADLLSLLADESRVRRETIVFSGVCNWVRADLGNRKEHVRELLSVVRLASLDWEYLVNTVGKEPLVIHDMQCVQLYLRCLQRKLVSSPSGNRGKHWKATGTWIELTEPRAIEFRWGVSAVAFGGELFCASGNFWTEWTPRPALELSAPAQRPPDVIVYSGWNLCVAADSLYAIAITAPSRQVYKLTGSEPWALVHSALGKTGYLCAATAFNSRICVADVNTQSIEALDTTRPERGFERMCAFPAGLRNNFALCVLDGRLLTVGGKTAAGPTNQVHIFDPRTATWNRGPPLGEARSCISAVEHDGQLVIAGGLSGTGDAMDTVEMLVDGEWKALPSLQHKRYQCGLAVLDDALYAIRGYESGCSVEMLRLEKEQ